MTCTELTKLPILCNQCFAIRKEFATEFICDRFLMKQMCSSKQRILSTALILIRMAHIVWKNSACIVLRTICIHERTGKGISKTSIPVSKEFYLNASHV